MAVPKELLGDIRERGDRSGVLTADRYFSAIKACFSDCDGGFCPTKLFEAGTKEEWAKELRRARKQLTYSGDDMLVLPDTITKSAGDDPDIAGSIMNFNAIVTTSSRDRDKDILDTKGATLDPKAPLLWQHVPMIPIGRLVRQVQNTGTKLIAKFAIGDTAQGRDAAALIELGALRISHGFDPTEYEPNEDDEGYNFLKFMIYEVSVVSVPANEEAVITAFSRKQLKSALIGGWAKKKFDDRLVQVAVIDDVPAKSTEACECHKKSIETEAVVAGKVESPTKRLKRFGAGDYATAERWNAFVENVTKVLASKGLPITDIDGDYQEDGNDNPGVDDTPRIYHCPNCGFDGELEVFDPRTAKAKAMNTNKAKMSKEDMDSLNEAHEDMKCMKDMGDLPRHHSALCGRAMANVKSVMPGMTDNLEDTFAPENIGVALKAMGGDKVKCVKDAYEDMAALHQDSSNRKHKSLAYSSMCHMAKAMGESQPMPGSLMPMPGAVAEPNKPGLHGDETTAQSGYDRGDMKNFKSKKEQVTELAIGMSASDLRSLQSVVANLAEIEELQAS